jgi:RNA polymerase primary sigma factor
MGAQRVEPSGDDDVMLDLRRQARLAPRIGPGEQDDLLDRSAAGDPVSQERLVAANLGMVIRLAEAREDQGLSLPDLVQEGSLGLVEAVRGFTPSGRPDFVAFAEQKIGEKMDAALATEAAAVRDAELLVNAANDYERTELLVARELRRAPTSNEIAEKLEWTVERTEYVARVVAEARRRHDEELLAFIDPDAIEIDDTVDGE